LNNSGSIQGISDYYTSSGHYGIGVAVGSSSLLGGLNNSGTITGGYQAIGLSNSTLLNGLTNSGNLNGLSGGISINNSLVTGGIVNSGVITSSITSTGSLTIGGGVGGINLGQSSVIGNIQNSGVINSIYGIDVAGSNITSSINNSGTITAFADLVVFDSTIGGNIANSGSLTGLINVVVENSLVGGTIRNEANGVVDGYIGIGIVGSTVVGGVINEGLITKLATSGYFGGGTSLAAGIFLIDSKIEGGVTNSGSISGYSSGVTMESNPEINGFGNSGYIQGGGLLNAQSSVGGWYANATGGVGYGVVSFANGISGGFINSGTILGNGGISVLDSVVLDTSSISAYTSSFVYGGNAGGVLLENSSIALGFNNSGLIGGYAGSASFEGALIQSFDPSPSVGGSYGQVNGGSAFGVAISQSNIEGIFNQGVIEGVGGSASGRVDFTNSGLTSYINYWVQGGSGNGLQINLSSIGGGIFNSGVIRGVGGSASLITQDSITPSSTYYSAQGGYGAGLSVSASLINGNISNSGLIQGTGGSAYANSPLSSVQGGQGSGLQVSSRWGGVSGGLGARIISGFNTLVNGVVQNSGTIQGVGGSALGGMVAFAGEGSGVRVDGGFSYGPTSFDIAPSISGGVTIAGSVNNSGFIQGVGGNATGIVAIGGNGYGIFLGGGTPSVGGGMLFAPAPYLSGGVVINGSINNSGLLQGIGGIASGTDSNQDGLGYGLYLGSNTSVSGGINNSGAIIGSGFALAAFGAAISGGITNSGLMQGLGQNISAYSSLGDLAGIYIAGSTIAGGIQNLSGATISGGNTGINLVYANVAGGITNSGLIQGRDVTSWDSRGINLDNTNINGSLVNNFGATISGGTAGVNLIDATISGDIVNHGLIEGTYSLRHSGTGIWAAGSTIGGGIINAGVIQGVAYGVIFKGNNTSSSGPYAHAPSLISGGIINSGTIIGSNESGIYIVDSLVTGKGISNSGLISGGKTGISLASNTLLTGGINNSGTISGSTYSIYVDTTSTLSGGINITGTSAALVGDVSANAANMNLKSGAAFTNTNAISVNTFNVENGAIFNFANGASTTYGSTTTGALSIASGVQAINGVNNSGTIAVAAGQTPTITGNYHQVSGGVYQPQLISATNYGKLNVTGIATLDPGAIISVNVVGTPYLVNGSTVSGVFNAGTLSAGTVTGKASNVTVVDNSALLSFITSTAANPNSIDLIATQTLNMVTAVEQNNNPAAIGAATVLQGMSYAPPASMQGVLNALYQLPTSLAVSNAISQTLPALTGAGSLIAAQSQQGLNQIMQGRQNQLRGLSSGEEYIGNRNAWMKGFGSWASQGDLNNISGYKVNTGGLAVGIDHELSPKANIGAVFAFANSSVNSNSSVAASGMTVNTYQLGAYGDYTVRPDIQVNYQADFGLNNNKEYRNLSAFNGVQGVSSSASGVNANGNYNSYVGHLGAGLRQFFPVAENTTLIPSLRADYTTVQSNGYTESGAGSLNLNANSQTYNMMLLSGDVRVDQMLSEKLKLSANIGAGYNTLNNQVQMTTAFQGGGPAFTTNGLQTSPWLYNAGLGLSGRISKEVEMNVRYDTQFSASSYNNQMVSAKLKFFY